VKGGLHTCVSSGSALCKGGSLCESCVGGDYNIERVYANPHSFTIAWNDRSARFKFFLLQVQLMLVWLFFLRKLLILRNVVNGADVGSSDGRIGKSHVV